MPDDRTMAGRVADGMSSRGLAGKRDYVRSLEHRRDEEALSLLIECLCDESWYLRELAEAALLKTGDRCGEALLPLLEQGLWFSRTSAARVLGQLGVRRAAAPLLALTSDRVEWVVREAYASLVTLGNRGGAARIAWELHRLPPERRSEPLRRLAVLDRALAERLERLLAAGELMSQPDPESLADDAPLVRATEEGVRWQVLNALPPVKPGMPPPETATAVHGALDASPRP